MDKARKMPTRFTSGKRYAMPLIRGGKRQYLAGPAPPTRNAKWRRVRRGLARFTTRRNRRFTKSGYTLSKVLNSIAETKLLAVNQVIRQSPEAIQAGAYATMYRMCTGDNPSAWSGTWKDLGGIAIPQGDGGGQRDGKYVYLQKTHLSVNIDMQFNAEVVPPTEFRVIVGKLKRQDSPTGFTRDPASTLFLNNTGDAVGHVASGFEGPDLMLQPLNKRFFYIKSDRKFVLSPALATTGGGYSGKYPTMKNMVFNLGYYKKTLYSNSNLPMDLDYSWFIIIYARSINSHSVAANGYEVNVRGTTSFKDV